MHKNNRPSYIIQEYLHQGNTFPYINLFAAKLFQFFNPFYAEAFQFFPHQAGSAFLENHAKILALKGLNMSCLLFCSLHGVLTGKLSITGYLKSIWPTILEIASTRCVISSKEMQVNHA